MLPTRVFFTHSSYLIEDHEYVQIKTSHDPLVCEYANLIEALANCLKFGVRRIEIIGASRIIDELQGVLEPSIYSLWETIYRKCLPHFIDVYFVKLSEEQLMDNLTSSDEELVNSINRIHREESKRLGEKRFKARFR